MKRYVRNPLVWGTLLLAALLVLGGCGNGGGVSMNGNTAAAVDGAAADGTNEPAAGNPKEPAGTDNAALTEADDATEPEQPAVEPEPAVAAEPDAATATKGGGDSEENGTDKAAADAGADAEQEHDHVGHEPAADKAEQPKPAKPAVEGKSNEAPAPADKPETKKSTVKPAKPAKPAPAPASEPERKPAVHIVEIKDFAFAPGSIEIHVGDTVRFVNRDDVAHTATADDGSFDTGLLEKDKSGEVVFKKAGSFGYFCTPHPAMKAAIVVKE